MNDITLAHRTDLGSRGTTSPYLMRFRSVSLCTDGSSILASPVKGKSSPTAHEIERLISLFANGKLSEEQMRSKLDKLLGGPEIAKLSGRRERLSKQINALYIRLDSMIAEVKGELEKSRRLSREVDKTLKGLGVKQGE